MVIAPIKIYIVDAFTDQLFGGNQAGVVLLRGEQAFPEDSFMQKIAAELKHSETAFVKRMDIDTYQLRYFTPEGEVPLCGHATISAFTVLLEECIIACGSFLVQTAAGALRVSVEPDKIWLEMPQGEIVKTLSQEESEQIYAAYQIQTTDQMPGLQPCIVNAGLPDILLPVGSKEALDHAMQDRDTVIRLSRELGLVGVHMFFCPQEGEATAYCRNFAPMFGIDEESATGTSNAALTYYLSKQNLIQSNKINTFVQGEAIGKRSVILSKIDSNGKIWIGGGAVVSMQGTLRMEPQDTK